VGASITDLSGLIKNIQIRAPRNITPVDTKNGATQKLLCRSPAF
jgi:hypothetical protein